MAVEKSDFNLEDIFNCDIVVPTFVKSKKFDIERQICRNAHMVIHRPTDGRPDVYLFRYNSGIPRVGMLNPRNNCFVNSVLQVLSRMPGYIYSLRILRWIEETDDKIVKHLIHVIKEMEQRNVVNNDPLLRNIKKINKNFHYGAQEDAHEFYIGLLEHLEKTVPKSIFSRLKRLLYTTYAQTIICGSCKKPSVTRTSEPFLMLHCGLNVQRSLYQYFAAEFIDSYKCDNCHKTTRAMKKQAIQKPGTYFGLQLLRFSQGGFAHEKINDHISFPQILDLQSYSLQRNNQSNIYRLYAVIIHAGLSTEQGHYYAIVRTDDDKFCTFNDGVIVPDLQWSSVAKSNPYLLFYERLDQNQNHDDLTDPGPGSAKRILLSSD